MNKITCICLGVKNMEKAIKFYRDGLGYKTNCKENNPPVCFFDTPGTKFELYPLDLLVKDIDESSLKIGSGFSGFTLAYNVEKKEDVDKIIELVRNAGGKISYFGKDYEKQKIGDKLKDFDYEDIKKAVNILYIVSLITTVSFILISIIGGKK